MKKLFYKVASSVLFGLVLIGCQDDFLNTTPLSEIAESNVWSSAKLRSSSTRSVSRNLGMNIDP